MITSAIHCMHSQDLQQKVVKWYNMNPKSVPSEEELNQLLKKTFTSSFRPDYITVKNCLLPERYNVFKKRIDEFEVYDTDLWICGFPKTGTTWISEIAWLILHDHDYEGVKEADYNRVRMLEFGMLFDVEKEGVSFTGEGYELNSIEYARTQDHPRTIKSHFPFPLMPSQIANGTRNPRIIYTARNPMDTCVSYYHHCKNFEGFTGTLEEFSKLFIFDKVNYGGYPSHVLSFWEHRNKPNVFFLTYEDMKKDLPGVINTVAKFLGKTITEQENKRLQEHVSFDSMKNNPAVNKEPVIRSIEDKGGDVKNITPFIRAGKSGGYKNVMSPETISLFQYWMKKKFEGSGLNLVD